MKSKLEKIQAQALKALATVTTPQALEEWHVDILGRKQGKLTEVLKSLSSLSVEEKKEIGPLANKLKQALQVAYEEKKEDLEASADTIDISLPGIKPRQGHLHLVSQTIAEIDDIFKRIGFTRTRHPEVEWDFYAFEALNIPQGHPARDDWETFFITPEDAKKSKRMILTPHTSNGQVREMEKKELPIRMINIAKCYRRQADVTHTQMFHQFEGLYIDKDVSIGHLKGVMEYFAKAFFGQEREIRLRPFHFKFTEPSFEIDITCGLCLGEGCKFCKEGWVELGGSGMVHPNVLKAGLQPGSDSSSKIDTKEYNGFAFGWGVERVALMREGISVPDLRELYRNDLRFLEQF